MSGRSTSAAALSSALVIAACGASSGASSFSATPHYGTTTRARLSASRPPARSSASRPRARPSASRPQLSLEQLAGQRIVYAYSGLRPPPSLLSAIRAGEAAGVILFGPNISSRGQIRGVIAQLQRAALSSPVHARLLILTDQEGGEVRRLPGAPGLSEKLIGEQRDPLGAAAAAGIGAGRNLASVGINVNLAPVLDVYRRPGNFIDEFQRSYSSQPAKVGRLGAAFISAQQRVGVVATAKHFPGLGSAARGENTDLGPVLLDRSLRTLRSVDEAPYRAGIAAGVKMVMTSWALYPALDPRRPAGFSPTVIKRELRGRLHFHGVTITDAIDAGAVTRFGGVGRRGLLAAEAGADLILCATGNADHTTSPEGLAVLRALVTALRNHQLSRSAASEAAARVLSLRRQRGS